MYCLTEAILKDSFVRLEVLPSRQISHSEMIPHPKHGEVRVVVGFEIAAGKTRVVVFVFSEDGHLVRDQHPDPGQDVETFADRRTRRCCGRREPKPSQPCTGVRL